VFCLPAGGVSAGVRCRSRRVPPSHGTNFGTVPERIVATSDVPVIIVCYEDPDVDAVEHATQAGSS